MCGLTYQKRITNKHSISGYGFRKGREIIELVYEVADLLAIGSAFYCHIINYEEGIKNYHNINSRIWSLPSRDVLIGDCFRNWIASYNFEDLLSDNIDRQSSGHELGLSIMQFDFSKIYI